MIKAACYKKHCNICHSDKAGPGGSTLSLIKSTMTTRRRIMLARNKLRRPTIGPLIQLRGRKIGSGFLGLPPELRLLIYMHCIEPSIHPVPLCGWIEGGGKHADYPGADEASLLKWTAQMPLFLHATSKIPASLLRVCWQINYEATAELYRHIEFDIRPTRLTTRPQLTYWLQHHPIRFVSRLTVPFGLAVVPHLETVSSAAQLCTDEVWHMVCLLNKMPNLQDLTLALLTTLDSRDDLFDDWHCRSAVRVFDIIKQSLRPEVQLWIHRSAWPHETPGDIEDFPMHVSDFLVSRGYQLRQNPVFHTRLLHMKGYRIEYWQALRSFS